jgi:hypothetical protein
MAQKKNIEEEYKLLGIRFLGDMYSFVKDFINISGEKIKQLFLVLKKLPIEANQSSDKKDRVKLL